MAIRDWFGFPSRPQLVAGQLLEPKPSTGRVYQLTTGQEVQVDVTDLPVSRGAALSLPAVARGVTLLATTVAGLPLERVDANGRRVELGWVAQPEEGRPRFTTFTDIARDLILDGIAYLKIVRRDSTGAPKLGGTEYCRLRDVSSTQLPDGRWTITHLGRVVDPADVIGFEGWHDGIRNHGARIIRTGLALQAAARRYADTPRPSERLRNVSGYELSDEEIDQAILNYKTARSGEGVAYINPGFEVDTVGWDAAQLQLVEGRQFVNAELANLLGLPAHLIAGANNSGASLTYANVGQENRFVVDYGLKSLIQCIESRLSMSDTIGQAWQSQVTPRGTSIRFNLDALLRGNPLERAQLYQILIPLGVLTSDEARTMEDLAPTGGVPA